MGNNSFTTTSNQSWFSRIGSALTGIIFGLLLFLGAFVVLTLNEGRAIDRAKTLEAGESQVISVSVESVMPENDKKLIHLSGEAKAGKPVSDPNFGLSANGLKLRREVEMYQWKESQTSETTKKLGGGEETTTTYSYDKTWSDKLIVSASFKKPEGHTNPESMPYESETFVAEGIRVGTFSLPQSLIARINNFRTHPVTAEEAAAAAQELNMKFKTTAGGSLYIGEDPDSPKVGDVKVSWEVAPSGPVSIVAKQIGQTLEPFAVGKRGNIELLQLGTVSAEAMFQKAKQDNTILTWGLRILGFVMMLFGLMLMMKIFSVLASLIPFFGNLVGAGAAIIAFALALPLSLLTIAVAWIAFRPLVAIPLLLIAVGSVLFAMTRLRKPAPAL